MSEKFELSADQQKVVDLLDTPNSVLVTGSAGTGKSRGFKAWLDRGRRIPILASTGAAAVLLGGRTFHSFFGLGIMQGHIDKIIFDAVEKPTIRKNILNTDRLAIDEISMLSSTTLAVAEQITRMIKGVNKPWGGIKIIALGDFLQLPPITKGSSTVDWAFKGDVWHKTDFKIGLLKEIIRTRDSEFANVLNRVRKGHYDTEVYEFLLNLHRPIDSSFEGTRLYPHRARVETVNMEMLHNLPGDLVQIQTTFKGDLRYVKSLTQTMPIPETLNIKEGALVMIRRNAPDFSYVNGSLGIVKVIKEDYLELELFSGRTISLGKANFDWTDGSGNPVCSARNFPLTLAWACTIHKAQGATIDRVSVDLRGVWEAGQAYVALSRVRESENLTVEGWDSQSICADPEVVAYYEHLEQNY